VPAATGDLAVTFLGVSTLLLDDGDSSVMTDGFFSRPSLRTVAFGELSPDLTRIDSALTRLGPGKPVTYGGFTLTFLEPQHCLPDRYPGRITAPVWQGLDPHRPRHRGRHCDLTPTTGPLQ